MYYILYILDYTKHGDDEYFDTYCAKIDVVPLNLVDSLYSWRKESIDNGNHTALHLNRKHLYFVKLLDDSTFLIYFNYR